MATEVKAAQPEAGALSTDQTLIQLLTAAWATQAVSTAARLGIPDVLAERARTAREVASELELDAGAAYGLLRALASLGVLERRADGRFDREGVREGAFGRGLRDDARHPDEEPVFPDRGPASRLNKEES